MSIQRNLKLIDAEALPVYPLGRSERLDNHSFQKWWFHRWLSSRTFKLMNWECQGMARALFDMAQTESPIGTLPDDDEELAVMLRVDERRVAELRRMEFGPLRGWVHCDCDGEVRLMHPVVLEQVQDALDRREARGLSKEEQAGRKRLQRLREGLRALNVDQTVLADEVLIRRMDDWLTANWRRTRTAEAYGRVLMQAVEQKWIASGLSL